MIYVYKDRIINIEWTVLKGTSNVREDFSRALVKCFLIGPNNKYLLDATATNGTLIMEIPPGLPEGIYSLELIYAKNWGNLRRLNGGFPSWHIPPIDGCREPGPIDCRYNDRCIMRSRKDNLFGITEYESEATNIGEGEVVIRIKSNVASYGYDGLSAYEIAVLRGDFWGTEEEYIKNSGVTVDDVLSLESKNPVQNKVVTIAINDLKDRINNSLFTSLGGISESEFNNVIDPGYYTYSLQDGTGEINGILIVSRHGYSITSQKRYELAGAYQRTFTDEGWEEWGDEFIFKLRKHIDNDTVYWDGGNQVIKAKGGGGDEIQIITIGINPNDVDRVTITAEGDDVIETTVTEAKDSYVIKVKKGGSAIVNIVAADGYVVSQVNVDKVSQGKIERFVFEEMQEDHTMYVWMAVDEEEQTDHDFLIRSDHPAVTYSSIGTCLASLQEDYPDGLTKDIMISCTMKSKEIRNSQYNSKFGIWVSSLSNWNQNSPYTLTINGNDLYTIDCKWLGGLEFSSIDNVVFKNLSIKNYYNQLGQSTPEELAAIMFRKSNFGDDCRNIILYNCNFDGYCVNSSGNRAYAWAGVRMKSTINCIVRKCTFKDAGSVVLMMSGCSSIEITGNAIQGDYHTDSSTSLISHPVIISATGNNGVIKMVDNDLNGVSMREYAVSLSGFKQVEIARNTIRNGSGQFFSISSSEKLSIIDNVIHDNITNGLYSYTRRVFGCGNIGKLEFRNNTVYMNGRFSTSQEVLAAGNVADIVNCNNIVMDPLGRCYVLLNLNGGITGSYVAFNNLYASSFYNNVATNRWSHFKPLVCSNNNPDDGYLNMNFTEQNRLLSAFQAAGYETGSWALAETAVILNVQNQGADYKLIENLADTYQAYILGLPEFDFDYKKHDDSAATIGAYNLQGIEWDESTDDSIGYEGVNTVDQATFTDAEIYQIPTDDTIVLQLNSKNRNALLKTTLTPETGAQTVSFGQVTSLALSCVSREGMYVNDNLYDVEIERLSYE